MGGPDAPDTLLLLMDLKATYIDPVNTSYPGTQLPRVIHNFPDTS